MEDETKAGGDEATKENVADESCETVEGKEVLNRVHEADSPLDSVVKPAVEELTQTVESLVQNVVDHSSSYVAQVETGFEKLGQAVKLEPAEQENADSDEHSRAYHAQPFVAVTAEPRASWTNCCGLLDVLRPSDQSSW